MSTRSLIEIDHDRFGTIKRDPQLFLQALLEYMRNPTSESLKQDLWTLFGVNVFGQRHHSSPYHIQWGHTHRHTYKGQGN